MFQNELRHVSRNIFRRCEACMEAGDNLNYRGKINSKLLLDTGLLCSKGSLLGDTIGGTVCGIQTL
jgi:hypothetical protein